MSLKKILTSTIAAAFTGLSLSVAAVGAAPATGFTLFGAASLISPGHNSSTAAELVSETSNATNPLGGVDLDISDNLTFADIETLSTDFNATDDDCAAGSPRFQLALDTNSDGATDGNVFVYLGEYPNYTDCPAGWQTSGNLVEDTDYIDTSQLGGTFYDTYANALVSLGTAKVLGVQLVTDAGYTDTADGEQTILVDNVTLNQLIVTFEEVPDEVVLTKEDCKKGGWQQFTGNPGPFKNQGQCVSHFARQQRVTQSNSTEF